MFKRKIFIFVQLRTAFPSLLLALNKKVYFTHTIDIQLSLRHNPTYILYVDSLGIRPFVSEVLVEIISESTRYLVKLREFFQ